MRVTESLCDFRLEGTLVGLTVAHGVALGLWGAGWGLGLMRRFGKDLDNGSGALSCQAAIHP